MSFLKNLFKAQVSNSIVFLKLKELENAKWIWVFSEKLMFSVSSYESQITTVKNKFKTQIRFDY